MNTLHSTPIFVFFFFCVVNKNVHSQDLKWNKIDQ